MYWLETCRVAALACADTVEVPAGIGFPRVRRLRQPRRIAFVLVRDLLAWDVRWLSAGPWPWRAVPQRSGGESQSCRPSGPLTDLVVGLGRQVAFGRAVAMAGRAATIRRRVAIMPSERFVHGHARSAARPPRVAAPYDGSMEASLNVYIPYEDPEAPVRARACPVSRPAAARGGPVRRIHGGEFERLHTLPSRAPFPSSMRARWSRS